MNKAAILLCHHYKDPIGAGIENREIKEIKKYYSKCGFMFDNNSIIKSSYFEDCLEDKDTLTRLMRTLKKNNYSILCVYNLDVLSSDPNALCKIINILNDNNIALKSLENEEPEECN